MKSKEVIFLDIFKDRILPLINNSGKTDRFLEEAIELPRGIIYKWKNGKNKNYKFYIVEIAAYFKVSTDYLIGKTDDPSPPGVEGQPTPVSESGLSPLDKRLNELLSVSSDETKRLMIDLLEKMQKR